MIQKKRPSDAMLRVAGLKYGYIPVDLMRKKPSPAMRLLQRRAVREMVRNG